MIHASVRSSTSSNKGEPSNSNFTRQGSLRKVVPGEHNKLPKLGYHNEEAHKVYKVFHQEYCILAEYKMIQGENIRSVYVIPSRESSFVWFGVIFVRTGLYKEGIFRFNIHIPESFPDCEHPKVLFTSEVFHPVIDCESGELNLKGGFPEWKKGEQHIWQILKYITWIFINVQGSLEHSVNADMAHMYKFDRESFGSRVRECVELSTERIYDPPATDDKHYLTFEPYRAGVHGAVRESMLAGGGSGEEHCNSVGHSWVAAGTFQPLSSVTDPVH